MFTGSAICTDLLVHQICFDICPQGPSASAYVTYIRSEDALRAIQCVNNVVVDGRTLKVMKLGTKKV